jgi:uncharacterized protein (DUF2237 family)
MNAAIRCEIGDDEPPHDLDAATSVYVFTYAPGVTEDWGEIVVCAACADKFAERARQVGADVERLPQHPQPPTGPFLFPAQTSALMHVRYRE